MEQERDYLRLKRVAILQSSYIPWKGYFDMIQQVDEFVLFDDVQFTRRDWRTRNKIKTPTGLQWLSIPVKHRENHQASDNAQLICDVEIVDPNWAERHWDLIKRNYVDSPFWSDYCKPVQQLYETVRAEKMLSKVNYSFLIGIAKLLHINTRITWSMDYHAQGRKTDRLLDILLQTGATHYLSGPSAKSYIVAEKFADANIHLEWMSYNYPEYPQLFPPFEHGVSVLDLVFNVGECFAGYMRSST
jgi:hypothetical protein